MKIPGAHLQIMSNKCTNFQKNPCIHLLEHAWTKSCPQTGDRKTDRQTDGQMDRQTDRVKPIYPPQTLFAGGIMKNNIWQHRKNRFHRCWITQVILYFCWLWRGCWQFEGKPCTYQECHSLNCHRNTGLCLKNNMTSIYLMYW